MLLLKISMSYQKQPEDNDLNEFLSVPIKI